jgi:hypothetical protein
MKKAKRYQEGGITITPQQSAAPTLPGLSGYGASSNSYPFQSDAGSGGGSTGSGVSQTFNIQPTATSGEPQSTSAFKKGGKVKAKTSSKPSSKSSASRGDGIAKRGKTRGRIV